MRRTAGNNRPYIWASRLGGPRLVPSSRTDQASRSPDFPGSAEATGQRLELDLARQWGGLVVLVSAPILFEILYLRICGRFMVMGVFVSAMPMRWIMSGMPGRSWWGIVGVALVFAGMNLAILVPVAFLERRLKRMGKWPKARPAPPMWDADADRPLATKGPP